MLIFDILKFSIFLPIILADELQAKNEQLHVKCEQRNYTASIGIQGM